MRIDRGIEISSGSLGMGLAVGLGISLAERRSRAGYRTYVLMGDGECNEGSVWEAAMAAAHFKLDTLTAIIDFNGLQSDGPCSTVMNMNSHDSKWRNFGWETRCVDGHDIAALYDALLSARLEPNKPLAVIARTTKGRGISFMEHSNDWHHAMLTNSSMTRLFLSRRSTRTQDILCWILTVLTRSAMVHGLFPAPAFGVSILKLLRKQQSSPGLYGGSGNFLGRNFSDSAQRILTGFSTSELRNKNMIGIAAGLERRGTTSPATTFSNFAAARSYEQIRVHLGTWDEVKVIGLAGGIALGVRGHTHCGVAGYGADADLTRGRQS